MISKYYGYCKECSDTIDSDDLIGIHDRYQGEIHICNECFEIYKNETWPICFVAGHEIKINKVIK